MIRRILRRGGDSSQGLEVRAHKVAENAPEEIPSKPSLLASYEPLDDGPLCDEFFIRLRRKVYGSLDQERVQCHREFGRLATGRPYFYIQPFNEQGWLFESIHSGWAISKAAKIFGEETFIREGVPRERAVLRLPRNPDGDAGRTYPRVVSEAFQQDDIPLALYEAKIVHWSKLLSAVVVSCLTGLSLVLVLLPPVALGGPYFSIGVRTSQFAAEPLTDEPTPNYYGIGPKLSAGYSLRQVLDVGLYGTSLPGRRKSLSLGQYDGLVSHGGLELSLRFARSVIFSLYGGSSQYQLRKPSAELAPGIEIEGKLSGLGGGVSLGAIIPNGKEHFVQVALEYEEHQYEQKSQTDPGNPTKRVIQCLGLAITYTFNSYKNYLIDNTIFKDFLDSMNY